MGYDYDTAFRGAIRLSVQFRHLLGVSVGVSNACMVHGMVSESCICRLRHVLPCVHDLFRAGCITLTTRHSPHRTFLHPLTVPLYTTPCTMLSTPRSPCTTLIHYLLYPRYPQVPSGAMRDGTPQSTAKVRPPYMCCAHAVVA